MEKINLERLHALRFHLWNILKMRKYIDGEQLSGWQWTENRGEEGLVGREWAWIQ